MVPLSLPPFLTVPDVCSRFRNEGAESGKKHAKLQALAKLTYGLSVKRWASEPKKHADLPFEVPESR